MKIIIGGATGAGIHLAALLSKDNYDCTLIDEDESLFDAIDSECDIRTLCGSPMSIRTLKDAGAAGASLFVAITPSESVNINACMLAHKIGTRKTMAMIDNYEYLAPAAEAFYLSMGVSTLICPAVLAAQDIAGGLRQSWTRGHWDIHDGALTLLAVKLHGTCGVLDTPLKDVCKPDDPYYIVAVKRGKDIIIPGGNDCLRDSDLVYFMTTEDNQQHVRRIAGKEHYSDVKNVIIIGGGATALRTALAAPSGVRIKIIEQDEERCEKLNQLLGDADALVIHGDGRDVQLLEEEGIANTQAFIALTGNAEANILACLTAKRAGVVKTIASVENSGYVGMAEEFDIGTIINKRSITASHIFQMMLTADVSNIHSLTLADADMAEFTAAAGSPVTKKAVKALGLPAGAAIGGIIREGKGLLVSGETHIASGDTVLVFCNSHILRKMQKYFKSGALW